MNVEALLVCGTLRSCPFILFPYYSHIGGVCPFIALYSPLIFPQQRLLEYFIRVEKWGELLRLFTFWFVWHPNFARTALLTLLSLSLSHSSFLTLCQHDSVLIVNSFCFGSLGLGSLLIALSRLCYCFCSWFDIPSFLAIPLFNSLYDVCIVCCTNIYLTTLFDVYCMLFRSIGCTVCTICLPNVMYTPPS
jgi:hypothetical protein